MKNVSMKPG